MPQCPYKYLDLDLGGYKLGAVSSSRDEVRPPSAPSDAAESGLLLDRDCRGHRRWPSRSLVSPPCLSRLAHSAAPETCPAGEGRIPHLCRKYRLVCPLNVAKRGELFRNTSGGESSEQRR